MEKWILIHRGVTADGSLIVESHSDLKGLDDEGEEASDGPDTSLSLGPNLGLRLGPN